ncbi:hypothetical protein BDF14DRAFT_1736820, partial [Spinellus fusiger]
KLWNRNLAATLYFRHSLLSSRENGTCPECFCRYNKRKYDFKDTARTKKRSKPIGLFSSSSSSSVITRVSAN